MSKNKTPILKIRYKNTAGSVPELILMHDHYPGIIRERLTGNVARVI
jgi:hypothetical protein